jgi:hypothetical protein
MSDAINSNHFADGWQNKKATEKVVDNAHRLAQDQSAVNRNVANKTMDVLVNSKNVDTTPTAPKTTQAPETSRAQPHVESSVVRSQPAQAARPEVHTEGARLQAQEQYQRLKGEHKILEQLSKNISQPEGAQTATRQAVQNTAQTPQANLSQNHQNGATFSLSQAMNGAARPQPRAQAEASSRNVDPRKFEDTNRARQGAERPDAQTATRQSGAATPEAVQVATQAAGASITPDRGGERSETDGEAGGERRVAADRRGPRTSSSGVGRSSRGATTDEMQRAIGGESSFTSDEGETEAETGEAAPADTVPQTDSLQVFNEFDSENPGIETVLAKRNILERHVIKSVVERRLMEIRGLDEQLGSRIEDIFAVKPLKERIIGDIEVEVGNFYKGIYNGGLIA